ncbi:MAG: hypothetical protein KDC12_10740 [Flavobacteriales bacterium]|nr:hypothetical protein [Flavobacteriales bacterium]
MKKIFSMLFMAAMLAVSFTACKKDPCADVTCDHGTCNDGTCDCETGYEGDECSTQMRSKFLGTFTGTESCSVSGNFPITWNINTSGTAVNKVIINNLYADGTAVSGTVSGTSITIPVQTATAQGFSFTVDGSGQISGNILTVTYTVSASGASETCTATITKQ